MKKVFDYAHSPGMEHPGLRRSSSRRSGRRFWPVLAVLVLATLYYSIRFSLLSRCAGCPRNHVRVPLYAADTLAKCRSLSVKPAAPLGFNNRTQSDRYEAGTLPVVIRNATIWTGREDGKDVVQGDILLENGLIKGVGNVNASLNTNDIIEINAEGAWVTPGVVDAHAHMGVWSAPALRGAADTDSHKELTMPWLRSLDGLNTHDDAYAHSIAGGVTTSLILPGSDSAIAGQAFTIKLRPTAERSSSSLLVEPPYGLNGTPVNYDIPPRWRHMKHACGERTLRQRIQEREWTPCGHIVKPLADEQEELGDFPEDLQWEALVDVLRGKVKVHTHCYEAVDLDAFVRLSNEFQFPVAAFHHAHEAYLVPAVLKRAYEQPPAVAMFASFARFKREAYRHSEFAPHILNEQGIKVIMKQAHYYGLPGNAALASVTTNAAELIGLAHRLGYIEEDVVIWDSHPLALGATPVQVFIDGIPQLEPSFSGKKDDGQAAPVTPSFDKEATAAVEFDGLPPLEPAPTTSAILFRNVSSMWRRDESGVYSVFQTRDTDDEGILFVERGEVVCAGSMGACTSFVNGDGLKVIDLEGGSITPALVSAGTSLGLQEIAGETTTSDGVVFDPLQGSIPAVLGEGSITRAVDGLMFGTRNALLAYRSGVSTAVASPISSGLLSGLGAHFSLGTKHRLEHGAVLSNVTAVHVSVLHGDGGPSVSTQIAALRRLLLGPYTGERGASLEAVAKGELPLVVNVKNADIMASLLALKQEVEADSGAQMKMTLVGAGESHLLAAELAAANVGVIVTLPRPFPFAWEGRRIVRGPPVTEQSLVTTLFAHGVTVGIGHQGIIDNASLSAWATRNLRWDAAWAHIDSHGLISKEDALNMATTNIETLLGATRGASDSDMVITKGGELLSFEGKVVAINSPRRGVVDLFE